jgi:hypothetical protein
MAPVGRPSRTPSPTPRTTFAPKRTLRITRVTSLETANLAQEKGMRPSPRASPRRERYRVADVVATGSAGAVPSPAATYLVGLPETTLQRPTEIILVRCASKFAPAFSLTLSDRLTRSRRCSSRAHSKKRCGQPCAVCGLSAAAYSGNGQSGVLLSPRLWLGIPRS